MKTYKVRFVPVALWAIALITLCVSQGITAPLTDDKEPLAEGKFKYLSPKTTDNSSTRLWIEIAGSNPNWKEKAKKSHYRFKEGVVGRKCDSRDCHSGFKDNYVAQLVQLPEGERRIKAREEQARLGLNRCQDCHSYAPIRDKTVACRLHFNKTDRVNCNSCHAEGEKVLVPVGDKKQVAIRDFDDRNDWPGHKLTKEEKLISCDKNCHIKDNPYAIASVCGNCHGENQLKLASYMTPNLLVHQTAKNNALPGFIRGFYKIFISGFAVFCGLYILLDIVKSKREDD